MDFCRVKDLNKGDEFMWFSTWYVVTERDDEFLRFKLKSQKNLVNGKLKFGVKSQLFVQVEKKK